MVKLIDGERWFCCPRCGQKLFKMMGSHSSAHGIEVYCKRCKRKVAVNV